MTSQAKKLYLHLRWRWSIKKFLAELLEKRWMDAIIPFIVMVGVVLMFGLSVENYFSSESLAFTSRQFAETAFVALAMAITLISGGIDLSVGSMFALVNFLALFLTHIYKLPIAGVIAICLVAGITMGMFNGFLIGYMKTKAFLTTLVSMISIRALVRMLYLKHGTDIAMAGKIEPYESHVWDFLGEGFVFGIPSNVFVLMVIALVMHIFLTRSRHGWRVTAVGGGRRPARHVGIKVEKTVFFTYAVSGLLTAIGAIFYAARLHSAASETGVGLEILTLMAVVIGGVSISGGKGTPGRVLIGIIIVMVIMNALLRNGVGGALNAFIQGGILVIAIGFDVKWLKHLFEAIEKIYVVPTYMKIPKPPDPRPGSGSVFAFNSRLKDAESIGVDRVDGPEDVILDRNDCLYGCDRRGLIIRFSKDDFSKREIFANVGGRPLGMAFDAEDNLVVCVAGMGLYGVRPEGKVFKMTDETNRNWTRLRDDSRIRMADDCDIAADGKIYFSELTNRYEMDDWPIDAQEGRPNGRLICYDPVKGKTRTVVKDLVSPNGICISHDGHSVLIALTWLSKVIRYWIQGPKKGKVETVINTLPIYPDNINRASDGNYWLASVGLRTPAYDLAMEMTRFRIKMVKFVPRDEWLYPNVNWGCVLKFNEKGQVLDSLWDPKGIFVHVTSMREHKGYLYLGGLHANRIGRIRLDGANANWVGPEAYWGKK